MVSLSPPFAGTVVRPRRSVVDNLDKRALALRLIDCGIIATLGCFLVGFIALGFQSQGIAYDHLGAEPAQVSIEEAGADSGIQTAAKPAVEPFFSN